MLQLGLKTSFRRSLRRVGAIALIAYTLGLPMMCGEQESGAPRPKLLPVAAARLNDLHGVDLQRDGIVPARYEPLEICTNDQFEFRQIRGSADRID